MLLIKMIQVCLLLKNLELDKFFKDGSCDVQSMVKSLPENIIFDLSKIVGNNNPTNEVDATCAIVNFFLSLVQQAKTSRELVTTIGFLPISSELKQIILQQLGKA